MILLKPIHEIFVKILANSTSTISTIPIIIMMVMIIIRLYIERKTIVPYEIKDENQFARV